VRDREEAIREEEGPGESGSPRTLGGYPVWSDSWGDAEVRFAGRGVERTRDETLALIEPAAPPVAALRQVHSARAVTVATPGFHGEGDALLTAERGLALSVITADCVPVMVATRRAVAAIHAGWRGLAAGVVPAALRALPGLDGEARAWLGPTIGPCCYEVSEEVAAEVVSGSGAEVALPGPAGRPHLDLRRAATLQLAAAGVTAVRALGPCTRCHPELSWSYRREGRAAGRNIAYVWRR
jgi:YfiH family protein